MKEVLKFALIFSLYICLKNWSRGHSGVFVEAIQLSPVCSVIESAGWAVILLLTCPTNLFQLRFISCSLTLCLFVLFVVFFFQVFWKGKEEAVTMLQEAITSIVEFHSYLQSRTGKCLHFSLHTYNLLKSEHFISSSSSGVKQHKSMYDLKCRWTHPDIPVWNHDSRTKNMPVFPVCGFQMPESEITLWCRAPCTWRPSSWVTLPSPCTWGLVWWQIANLSTSTPPW